MRALLVEDHPELRSHAHRALRTAGFEVDNAPDLDEAEACYDVADYDVVLLDRHLPDGDGLEWLRSLRERGETTPVLIMTAAMRCVESRVEGLNGGADDYLIKPIEFDELIARVRAVLRRPRNMGCNTSRVADVEFDADAREVLVNGKTVPLPRRETCLLECLMRRPGRIVAKGSLEENLYGFESEVTPNAIEVSVHRLRSALRRAGSRAEIRTVRGIGYLVHDPVPAVPATSLRPEARPSVSLASA